MNLLQQYNNQKNSSRSYANGTIVSNDLENLISKYKEGTLSDNEKKLLMSQLQEVSQAPLATFENFQKQFYSNSIAQGTDFYLNTGYTTEEDIKEAPTSSGRILGQWPEDILSEEDQKKIQQKGYVIEEVGTRGRLQQTFAKDTNLVEPSRIRGQFVTATGEQLFYGSSGEMWPVPDFGGDLDKRSDFLKKVAYNNMVIYDKSHVNVAGCGDNMTCITASTNMLQNSIEAWNLAIKDKNSPYFGGAPINANTNKMSAMSHLKFWGDTGTVKGKQEEQNYKNAGFQQHTINRNDFLVEDGDGNMVLDPTALSNFFGNQMQIGNIMGIHSGPGDGPSHAISYQGGMFYNGRDGRIPLDFSTDKGRKHAENFIQTQIDKGYNPDRIMSNIRFLASDDPTEYRKYGLPYQYATWNLDDLFVTDKSNKNFGNLFYTTFTGDQNYQNYLQGINDQNELYKTIYTDLSGKNLNTLSTDHQDSDIIQSKRGDLIPVVSESEDDPIQEEEEESWWEWGERQIQEYIPDWWPDFERGGNVPPSFKRGGTVGSGCPECDAKRLAQRMSPPSFHHGGEHDNSLIDLENNAYYNDWNDGIQIYEESISNLESEIQKNVNERASIPRGNIFTKRGKRYKEARKELKDRNEVLQTKLDKEIIFNENNIVSRDKWVNDRTALYPVQLIVYPPGYSKMESGHIESRMLGNYNGNDINIDALGWLGTMYPIRDQRLRGEGKTQEEINEMWQRSLDLDNPVSAATDIDGHVFYQSATSVNSWFDGNREITYDPNDQIYYSNPNIRTAVLNLNHNQIQRYMNSAVTTTLPTSGGLNQEAREGVGLGGLIAELSGEVSYDEDGTRIYTGNIPLGDAGYSFIDNNCADATCRAFGIDANETDRILGATTDPQEVFDYIINADQFNLVPGSLTGTKVQSFDEFGNYIDNREAYVEQGGELFGIPNFAWEDLLTLEQKGFTLDKLSEGTFGDIIENAPNIAKELQNRIEFGWDWGEDVALNMLKSIEVSKLVDTFLDPNNTDRISGIANAIKTGDYSKIDGGDAFKTYIESTDHPFNDMGLVGEYLKWRASLDIDIVQNVAEFGYDTYKNVVEPISYIAPVIPSLWTYRIKNWLGFEDGGDVTRSYQDGDEVTIDPKVINQEDYRTMVQSMYSGLFNEEGKFYTPGRDYIKDGYTYNTAKSNDNCIHGVCYTLDRILGDNSFLGDSKGFGQYTGNEYFAENAASEGFLHQADYKIYGLNPGDIIQLTKPRETSVDAMGRPLYKPKAETSISRNITNSLGITDRETYSMPIGNKKPYHAEVILDKRVNENGTVDYLIAHNRGGTTMEARWKNEQELFNDLDNGSLFLNSYQGKDGMNKIKQDGINRAHQIQGYNENASLYNESIIPNYTVDDGTTFFSNDNTLDIFTGNYLEIGKMSNLPPHILNQLAINQLGIKEIETGSGSNRSTAKTIMGILDAAHPGDLQKKMREVQYHDGFLFDGDDISWKEVLYNDGIINDKIVAQEVVDYVNLSGGDYRTMDNILGLSYSDIFESKNAFMKYIDRENKLNPFEQKHAFVNQKQSKGEYQQKNLSERGRYMRDKFYSDSDGFQGPQQQFTSSLALSIDNYHKIAKMYPDLNESELINLTTLMHNAPGKAMSRDYVMHFLKNNSVDYVNAVNDAVSNYNIDTKFPNVMGYTYYNIDIDEVEISAERSGFTLNPFSKKKKFLGLFEEGGEVPSYDEGNHVHPHPDEDVGFLDKITNKIGDGLNKYNRLKEEGLDAGQYFKGIDLNPWAEGKTMSFEGYRAYPVSLSEVEIRDADGNIDNTRTYLANNYLDDGWTKWVGDVAGWVGDAYEYVKNIEMDMTEPNEVEKSLGISKSDKVSYSSSNPMSMKSMK